MEMKWRWLVGCSFSCFQQIKPLKAALANLHSNGMLPLYSKNKKVLEHYGTTERVMKGLASTYLISRANVGTKVRVIMRESAFILPPRPRTPIIMIGGGSGYSPFRGLCRELNFMQVKRKKIVCDVALFFSCTYSNKDWIYRDEMKALLSGTLYGQQSEPILKLLSCAFTRESKSRMTISMKIEEEKEAVWQLIQSGAHIFVCGSTAFGQNAWQGIEKVIKEKSGSSALLDEMRKEKRIAEEFFG